MADYHAVLRGNLLGGRVLPDVQEILYCLACIEVIPPASEQHWIFNHWILATEVAAVPEGAVVLVGDKVAECPCWLHASRCKVQIRGRLRLEQFPQVGQGQGQSGLGAGRGAFQAEPAPGQCKIEDASSILSVLKAVTAHDAWIQRRE